MEQFKMADVVQIKKARTRAGRVVSWSELEPLLSQLRQKLGCSKQEAMQYLGYAGGSHLDAWRKLDEVPILAMNSIKWVLHEAGVAPVAPKAVPHFTHDEMAQMFALAMGYIIPEAERKALLGKLAGELAR